MSTMTIELPEILTEAIQDQKVPLIELQSVIIKAVGDWLQSRPVQKPGNGQDAGRSRFGTSAVLFTETLITENRSLFERLAKL
jgi:hypothetical protein